MNFSTQTAATVHLSARGLHTTHTAQVHAAFRPPCQRLKVGANSASVRLAAPEATTIPIGANQVQFVELLCRQRRAALPFRRRYGTAETSRFRGLLRL